MANQKEYDLLFRLSAQLGGNYGSTFKSAQSAIASMKQYLTSLDYTDNEADEADDLQIKLEDRDSVWLCKWLNTIVQSAAASSSSTGSASGGGSSSSHDAGGKA